MSLGSVMMKKILAMRSGLYLYLYGNEQKGLRSRSSSRSDHAMFDITDMPRGVTFRFPNISRWKKSCWLARPENQTGHVESVSGRLLWRRGDDGGR